MEFISIHLEGGREGGGGQIQGTHNRMFFGSQVDGLELTELRGIISGSLRYCCLYTNTQSRKYTVTYPSIILPSPGFRSL